MKDEENRKTAMNDERGTMKGDKRREEISNVTFPPLFIVHHSSFIIHRSNYSRPCSLSWRQGTQNWADGLTLRRSRLIGLSQFWQMP